MCRTRRNTEKMVVEEEEDERTDGWQLKRYPQPDPNKPKHTFLIWITIICFDLCNI
jgi:hypothetical protein